MKIPNGIARMGAVFTFTIALLSYAHTSRAEHPAVMDGPADSSVQVPQTSYTGALPGTKGAYLRETDAPRLPWKGLFTPDGRFVAEEELRGDASSTVATPSSQAPPADTPAPAGSDARAIVRSISRESSSVRLEHGPIEKLGMPAMTMMFKVKDPALLDGVAEGDEVGVNFEMGGSGPVVTGFQK